MGNPVCLLVPRGQTTQAKVRQGEAPLKQKGEMLYNDKENSDFIIEIDLNFNNIERDVKRKLLSPSFGELLINSNATSTPYYIYSGKGSFSSNLNILAKSTRFGEKLWKKYINLPPIPIEYTGSIKWADRNASFYDEVNKDNAVFNEFSKALMKQYQEIFVLLEQQIEVEELNTVKEEAKKADKRN